MDFPNVTHVFQFGIPMNGEQYVHRLGRTGRAGKSGVGYTILYPYETSVFNNYRELKNLPIQKQTAPEVDEETSNSVYDAIRNVDLIVRKQAYGAWLGYYKAFAGKLKWSSETLVSVANEMATEAWGCEEVPGMDPKYVMSFTHVVVLSFLASCCVCMMMLRIDAKQTLFLIAGPLERWD